MKKGALAVPFSPFQFHNPVKIVYGPKAIDQLPDQINQLCPEMPADKPVVIVTDPGIVAVGLADKVFNIVKKAGFTPRLFAEVASDPGFDTVDKAVAVIKDSKSRCVIGLGGGSAIDVAKLSAVAASDNLEAASYALKRDLQLPARPKTIQTIAIPTTAGTGAEVTEVGVYSTARKEKQWTVSYRLVPQTALIDPLLTMGLPAGMTAATGLDALVHAIEAVTGKPGNNPLVQAFGMQAIQLICSSLEKALHYPDNVEARADMILGATLAGMAISAGNTAIAHGMGHALSAIGGIHHGRAVALCLDAVYVWNVDASPEVHAAIAQAMGLDISGMSAMQAGLAGAESFSRLLVATGVPLSLEPDGLGPGDLERFIDSIYAPENFAIVGNNCREPDEKDMAHFARQVLERR